MRETERLRGCDEVEVSVDTAAKLCNEATHCILLDLWDWSHAVCGGS